MVSHTLCFPSFAHNYVAFPPLSVHSFPLSCLKENTVIPYGVLILHFMPHIGSCFVHYVLSSECLCLLWPINMSMSYSCKNQNRQIRKPEDLLRPSSYIQLGSHLLLSSSSRAYFYITLLTWSFSLFLQFILLWPI